MPKFYNKYMDLLISTINYKKLLRGCWCFMIIKDVCQGFVISYQCKIRIGNNNSPSLSGWLQRCSTSANATLAYETALQFFSLCGDCASIALTPTGVRPQTQLFSQINQSMLALSLVLCWLSGTQMLSGGFVSTPTCQFFNSSLRDAVRVAK